MNETGAQHWVAHRDHYDRMYAKFQAALLSAAAIRPGEQVLDVGCGYGTTTLAAAEVARPGTAVGIDVSPTMLDLARARAVGVPNVTFVEADAQDHRFAPSSFDVALSRFGLMFFTDPVAALANLRRATRPGGRLAFVAWRSLARQPWLCVPGTAAARIVPVPGMETRDGPGMFSFADPDRVRSLLTAAGWTGVELASVTEKLPVGDSPEDAVAFLASGTLGRRLLDGSDEQTQARVLAEVRAALAPHTRGDGVRLGASVWLGQARA
ncbi:class I SAM-dependent methyltransferase [Cellulomonas sp. URHE0023]|uniref:class I SAM-dependent methyltransferase n=1 Tax=Cellulomonas sp. URHE0023 TaxID=1380354 RepID=UPI000485FAEB|nr:class I SAM-dependent methyltransferase [Cellulomonas sp. URHE0023]